MVDRQFAALRMELGRASLAGRIATIKAGLALPQGHQNSMIP